MTVKELIEVLEQYDPETPVVIRDRGKNANPSDYVDLQEKDVVKILGKPVFKDTTYIGHQLYDSSLPFSQRNKKELVSLTGK